MYFSEKEQFDCGFGFQTGTQRGKGGNVYTKQRKYQNTPCSLNPTLWCGCCFPSLLMKTSWHSGSSCFDSWVVTGLRSKRGNWHTGQAPLLALVLFCWHLTNKTLTSPHADLLLLLEMKATGASRSSNSSSTAFVSVLTEQRRMKPKQACSQQHSAPVGFIFRRVNHSSAMKTSHSFFL